MPAAARARSSHGVSALTWGIRDGAVFTAISLQVVSLPGAALNLPCFLSDLHRRPVPGYAVVKVPGASVARGVFVQEVT